MKTSGVKKKEGERKANRRLCVSGDSLEEVKLEVYTADGTGWDGGEEREVKMRAFAASLFRKRKGKVYFHYFSFYCTTFLRYSYTA